ncbi:hypothetical protein [Streptomyces rishiriensis]
MTYAERPQTVSREGSLGRLGSTVGLVDLTVWGAASGVPVRYHEEYDY